MAGGSGQRMGGSLPKQFMPLAGKPLLLHTLEAFHHSGIIDRIVIVLPEEHISTWKNILANVNVDIPHEVVAGGIERTFSVQNGLALLPDEGVIGIHDGVRPLISAEFIKRCFDGANEKGSAIPVLPIKSSVSRKTETGSEAVNRTDLFEVQTPQCFSASMLKAAYKNIGNQISTDDATVFEMAGNDPQLVEGAEHNIKITTPADLIFAEALLANPDL